MNKNEFTSLQIICKTNSNYNGKWSRGEVEADLQDLTGKPPKSPNHWIEYVISYNLSDDPDFTDNLEAMAIDPLVTRIQFRLGNDEVAVIKTRAR